MRAGIWGKAILAVIGTALTVLQGYGQSGTLAADGDYFKRHTALTDFVKLGVNDAGYAKCVTNINFRDPENTVKMVTMNSEDFRDDGQYYDLRANDGILTSVTLTSYSKGENPIPAGQYEKLQEEYLVHDELFEHLATGRLFPKLSLTCRVRSVHCEEFSEPGRSLCYRLGPPYRHLDFYDCHFTISW
jgi:hypothetical protein